MKRRLFNLAAAVSLLLCVVVMMLWVRSYWRYDALLRTRDDGGGLDAVSSGSSSLVMQRNWGMPSRTFQIQRESQRRLPGHAASDSVSDWEWKSKPTDPSDRWDSSVSARVIRWRFARFLWASHDPPAEAYSGRVLIVPYWLLTAVTAMLPMRRLYLFRRDRIPRTRHDLGLCTACGYDLRATPDCCPECGAVPTVTNAAT